jgi:hypothetical protein
MGALTPVKTGVHPYPVNLDTVFQRYDGQAGARVGVSPVIEIAITNWTLIRG